MMRTSILIPEPLHQQLVITSKQEGKSLSELVRELFNAALVARRKAHLKRIYDGLDSIRGIGPKGITDASTTIDKVLYGEHGAWKGHGE